MCCLNIVPWEGGSTNVSMPSSVYEGQLVVALILHVI